MMATSNAHSSNWQQKNQLQTENKTMWVKVDFNYTKIIPTLFFHGISPQKATYSKHQLPTTEFLSKSQTKSARNANIFDLEHSC